MPTQHTQMHGRMHTRMHARTHTPAVPQLAGPSRAVSNPFDDLCRERERLHAS